MRSTALAAILASTTILSGCAGTIAGVSIGSISSFAGFASTIFTGADLGEHAASLVTGKSCRFSEGLVRDDRDVCEDAGSSATRDDFRGIFVERVEADGTIIYAAPTYMPASVGAGENENNPDVIWAQIKQQKQLEDAARQVARADRGLHIDVAALASGQLSKDALAFLPAANSDAAAVAGDEEPASLTAAKPRDFSNPSDAERAAKARYVQAAADEPPVIDEKSLTVTMQIAQATGSGGPFIAPATSSKPVASKLVNGEPVIVMKILPLVSQVAFNGTTQEAAGMDAIEPVSAQSLMATLPNAADMFEETLVEPEPPVAPKAKAKAAPVEADPVETVQAEVKPVAPKPVKAKAPPPAPVIAPEDEAYQPPVSLPADLPAPLPPADPVVAVAPASGSEGVATNGPAPLIVMPQP